MLQGSRQSSASPGTRGTDEEEKGRGGTLGAKDDDSAGTNQAGGVKLTEEEEAEVEQLKERDREVRAHEQAHVAAGGRYVRGGIQYNYQTGPDGRQYAVGGEVSIDTSEVSGDPGASLRKAQAIRRAAMAPSEPSSHDHQAAAAAARMEAKARREQAKTRSEDFDSTKTGVEVMEDSTEKGDSRRIDLPVSGNRIEKGGVAAGYEASRKRPSSSAPSGPSRARLESPVKQDRSIDLYR